VRLWQVYVEVVSRAAGLVVNARLEATTLILTSLFTMPMVTTEKTSNTLKCHCNSTAVKE
jgi:hypothetical protein